jgi:hypothetical protein
VVGAPWGFDLEVARDPAPAIVDWSDAPAACRFPVTAATAADAAKTYTYKSFKQWLPCLTALNFRCNAASPLVVRARAHAKEAAAWLEGPWSNDFMFTPDCSSGFTGCQGI